MNFSNIIFPKVIEKNVCSRDWSEVQESIVSYKFPNRRISLNLGPENDSFVYNAQFCLNFIEDVFSGLLCKIVAKGKKVLNTQN